MTDFQYSSGNERPGQGFCEFLYDAKALNIILFNVDLELYFIVCKPAGYGLVAFLMYTFLLKQINQNK